jgi:multidrug efflux pump subunit AcrA (membrane-fusion protein)
MDAATHRFRFRAGTVLAIIAVVAVIAAASTFSRWSGPAAATWLQLWTASAAENSPHDSHEEAAHDHGDHSHEPAFVELSPQAQRNIGLQTAKVTRGDFKRSISVPAVIVERPGRSTVEVTAPLTGIVERIGVIQGEAVTPSQFLFEQRLTHEELVQAQGEFLRTAEELDVLDREIERLERVTANGAIAGKTLLERQYEKQRHEAAMRAQREALRLHGISEEQIDTILRTRKLLSKLEVTAPTPDETTAAPGPVLYQVDKLNVDKGQHVTAGEALAELSDHAVLYIEGDAFEHDIPAVTRAVSENWPIDAVIAHAAGNTLIKDIEILYSANQIDRESRTFHFYLKLPNELLSDRQTDGHRFINWRFKPGQRVELLVPVERLADKLVLPARAVVQDGAETYLFVPNGNRFDRRAAHVESNDQRSAVIADDGSLYPGEEVVVQGAQQLQLQWKNQAGGAIDPHAGHNH